MLRFVGLTALLSLLLAVGSQAQLPPLTGSYRIVGMPSAEVHIAPVPLTPAFVGVVTINGQPVDGESMVIMPTETPGEFTAKNGKGHTIDIHEDADGNLTGTVRDGPNAGRTTKWERE